MQNRFTVVEIIVGIQDTMNCIVNCIPHDYGLVNTFSFCIIFIICGIEIDSFISFMGFRRFIMWERRMSIRKLFANLDSSKVCREFYS